MNLDESMLRRKIQDLQHYRRLGLTTPADIEKYDTDLAKRVCIFIISFLFQLQVFNHVAFRHSRLRRGLVITLLSAYKLEQVDANLRGQILAVPV